MGIYGIFLIMGNAGFISSTITPIREARQMELKPRDPQSGTTRSKVLRRES